MLTNLKTIHKPQSLEDAFRLLKETTAYPLYGAGASLIRSDRDEIESAVDLTAVIPTQSGLDRATLRMGSGCTLEALRSEELLAADAKLGDGLTAILAMEAPPTLRNALTLGDVFMECHPTSPLMIMLAGLQTEVSVYDGPERVSMRVRDWFSLVPEQRRELILLEILCHEYTGWRYAFEKVSRTPADSPIVGAMAFCRAGQSSGAFSVVGGIGDHPAHYLDGMQSTF